MAKEAVGPNPYVLAGLSAFEIINGLQQAQMIRETTALTKEIADINAMFAEQDAAEALRVGLSEQARYQQVIDSTLKSQRVAYIVNKVDPNFGTAAEVQAETKLTGFLNQVDLRNKAYSNALGLKREAINIKTQGALQSAQGSAQASITQSSAITSGLGVAASAYTAYSNREKG